MTKATARKAAEQTKRFRRFYLLGSLLLALIMLGPGLKPGTIFLLDMPWPDKMYMGSIFADGIRNYTPVMAIVWLLGQLVAPWLLQKLILISILTFTTWSMAHFLESFTQKRTAIALGSILYLVNPFVLSRLAAGQWLVLGGYALLPTIARLILRQMRYKDKKSNIRPLLLTWILLGIVSTHFWYIATLILAPLVLNVVYTRINAKNIKINRWTVTIIIFVLFAIICSYVLNEKQLSTISKTDFLAFSTSGSKPFGSWDSIFMMRGFWHSTGGLTPKINALWTMCCVILLCCVVYMVASFWKKDRKIAIYIATVFFVCFALAVGYGSAITTSITDILRVALPGYAGMRDTQKLVGILVFIESVSLSYAIDRIRIGQQIRTFSVVLISCIYGVCAITMTTNNYQYLQASHYPDGWQDVKTYLENSHAKRVLVLPWESYVTLPFAGNARVANPARLYLGPSANVRMSSDNKLIDQLIGSALDDQILSLKRSAAQLAAIGEMRYEYIVLMNVEDAESYAATLNETNITLVISTPDIALYKLPSLTE